jgi:putative phosphoribosyl transferase
MFLDPPFGYGAAMPRLSLSPIAAQIPWGEITLPGTLQLPDEAVGIVLFAHGSGSSRLSPRNERIAATLRAAGLGTLLFDLLTEDEDRQDAATEALRFNIELLASRLRAATRWTRAQREAEALPLGYFGAGTGAAAALLAAAEDTEAVSAIVCRSGRPDLAADALPFIAAPVLLVAGSEDELVLSANQAAFGRLTIRKSLEIVMGATHYFYEPGALEIVADSAASWFINHFTDGDSASGA